MNRFFGRSHNIYEDYIIIDGTDVNHIRNVLRMKPGAGPPGIPSADGEGTRMPGTDTIARGPSALRLPAHQVDG